VTLAVTGNTIFGRVSSTYRVTVFQGHPVPLTGSRRDIRLASYSGKTRLSVYFLYFAWRLWKSVVTLAVMGNTNFRSGFSIPVGFFNLYWVSVFKGHRLPLTGNRRDIRLVSYSRKTPTFCLFPVFSVAVMEKCYDACADEKYYFRSGFSTYFLVFQRVTLFEGHRVPLTGSRWDIRLVSYSGKTPTFCVFPCI
jgi:hypothetical protein